MANINTLREQIDQADRALLAILTGRVVLVKKIARYKHQHDLPPLDPSRWQQVQNTRQEWGMQLGLDPDFVYNLFECIHNYSLTIEGEICHK